MRVTGSICAGPNSAAGVSPAFTWARRALQCRGCAGLVQGTGQLLIDSLAVSEDEDTALPVEGVDVGIEGGRLCRVERFHYVDVVVVGLLDAAVVGELAPPPRPCPGLDSP